MPRTARKTFCSGIYHIIVQGDEKKYIFETTQNKRRYIYLLKHNSFKNDVEMISYCMMDNHAHILVYCPEIERVSRMMQECNTSYAIFFNQIRKKVGHVFRDRFKTETIFTKSHLINCIRYIHENPVKAGICSECKDYQYSSFREIKQLRKNVLDACGITKSVINEIVRYPHTEEEYMDECDEKMNLISAFEEIKDKYNLVLKQEIAKIYLELKEKTNALDKEIAEILGMHRNKLHRILKEEGIKKKKENMVII